jgi:ribosome biogenesis GTPase A
LEKAYPERLKERYQLDNLSDDVVAIFDHIGKLRGCLMGGGLIDYDKVAELVIREIRLEKFGPLSFERPQDIQIEENNV